MDEQTILDALDAATIEQLVRAVSKRCGAMLCRLEKPVPNPVPGSPDYLSANFLHGTSSHLQGMLRELQIDLDDAYRIRRSQASCDRRDADGEIIETPDEPE